MKKKIFNLRTRKSSALIASLQKKQSEIRNSSGGEETCGRCRAQLNLPPDSTLPLLVLWEARLHLEGSKHIRRLPTRVRVSCLQQSLK